MNVNNILIIQDEDSGYAHVNFNHNLTGGHSTVTLISELLNPCTLGNALFKL